MTEYHWSRTQGATKATKGIMSSSPLSQDMCANT